MRSTYLSGSSMVVTAGFIAILSGCSADLGPVSDDELQGTWSCENGDAGTVTLEDDHSFKISNVPSRRFYDIYPYFDLELTDEQSDGGGTWAIARSSDFGEYREIRFAFDGGVMDPIGDVPVFVGVGDDESLYLLFTDPDFSQRIECVLPN